MLYYSIFKDTPVGTVIIVASETHIVDISLSDTPKKEYILHESNELLRLAKKQLLEYFSGKRNHFELPLFFEGTPFQERVWNELQKIPYGESVTYGEIARRIKHANAYRAVGTAVGKNPIGIVIPCHRVFAAHGIGGYASGLDHKRALLNIEHIPIPDSDVQ